MADATETRIAPALTADEWEANLAHQDENARVFAAVNRLQSPRHGIAALALHGQPFGFTAEDVALLDLLEKTGHAFGPAVNNWLDEADRKALASLRDRIQALLPPEGTNA